MIGNAHLDPVWLWRWQEGFQETKATFRSALDRMNESDDFLFTSSSAAIYEWVELNDPGMFAEIKARIAEGRWHLVGGWWIQPDCNIPSGESFVRQGLYGQRYFKEKFGVTAKVGYNVDSFGHHGMLPQILKKSGMDYYVFMRPSPQEKGLPGRVFWWESDDGSRVLTFRIMFEYCTWWEDLEQHVARCATELKEPVSELMCFYGVGNHGGGPTKKNIESIRKLNEREDMPELEFSTPNLFFEDMDKPSAVYPVIHDELQMHAVGCYSAHAGIKQWNRKAENLLVMAEKFSVLANWMTDQPYPADLDRAWKNVLFNQFHDILAGTSIEPAYEDARNEYGEAIAIAERGLNYAIQSLAWNIGIEQVEGMKPIVVFNPNTWTTKVNVELELASFDKSYALLDETGRSIPYQLVQSLATTLGRCRISFWAELPSLGYAVFKLTPNAVATVDKKLTSPLKSNDYAMENGYFRIEFDPETGFITSLYDKAAQFEYMKAPARPVVIDDHSDTWSHDVTRYANEVGAFKAVSVRRVEHGPVKTVIRVTSQYGSSKLIQDYIMYPDQDQIDVQVTVDWREQFKMLKLAFPVHLSNTRYTYEIPYGHIERPHHGEEVPGQAWVDMSGLIPGTGKVYGLSILNDSKYSYSIHNNEICLTVLRSPVYAQHAPAVPDPEGLYSFMDQGLHRFKYALYPHQGTWEMAETVHRATELNQPPVILLETFHEGSLPQSESLLQIDKANIVVGAVKKAEDNADMIIRCYETAKIRTEAVIRLPRWNRTITVSFEPCEIKTIRVPQDIRQPFVETNLLEWQE
ncbi:alpha-mannosidase [Paenibacillus sacheonensis]|uniref:Alpha-mannosidase n=2 Tax=Paenibacillus sacheonensis TaxID=742054 RepID=A0A7X5BXC1_9BACL|nr:alpha-mannosidase [Paenibacillus sacheonensis]